MNSHLFFTPLYHFGEGNILKSQWIVKVICFVNHWLMTFMSTPTLHKTLVQKNLAPHEQFVHDSYGVGWKISASL